MLALTLVSDAPTGSIGAYRWLTIRLRKADFVLAVGIWVDFGPELGLAKNSLKVNKKLIFVHFIKPKLIIINRVMSVYYRDSLFVHMCTVCTCLSQ